MNPISAALARLATSILAGAPVGLLVGLAEPIAVAVSAGAIVAIGAFLFMPTERNRP